MSESSKRDGRDEGDGSRSYVPSLKERDRALIIIAQEIYGYVYGYGGRHCEGHLERIEMRMQAYLATVSDCPESNQA